MLVFNDNSAAVRILSVGSNAGGSAHFKPKYRYVTELVVKNKIGVYHILRGFNGSDMFTHSLARPAFEKCVTLVYGVGNVEHLVKVKQVWDSGGELKVSICLHIVRA